MLRVMASALAFSVAGAWDKCQGLSVAEIKSCRALMAVAPKHMPESCLMAWTARLSGMLVGTELIVV